MTEPATPGLFDPPAQRHSATSREAAARIVTGAKSLRGRVLMALLAAGPRGMTDEELQDGLLINPSTQRPRRVELVRMGLVLDSGTTRATRAGRRATVWVAK